MYNKYNPFKENRAEQMRHLWKYYVPIPGIDEAGKPLVLEGGRGSGKTMFFLCNSWRDKLEQLKKMKKPMSDILEDQFIGIYYRVDTAFVCAMIGDRREDWNKIFETYLTICLLKEFLHLLMSMFDEDICEKVEIINAVKKYAKKLNNDSTVNSVNDFISETEMYLDRIEDIINGVSEELGFRVVNLNRFITSICEEYNKLFHKEITFKVFIDEYETLQEYQQKIINTLIKHSTQPLIFNIGLRQNGMKTNLTISETETIESPHDYEIFTISIEDKNYGEILKEICRKRIQLGKEMAKIPLDANDNIEFYLGKYSIDEEVDRIIKSKVEPKYFDDLNSIIFDECTKLNMDNELIAEYKAILCDKKKPINTKLHYLLLNKKTSHSPSITELFESYKNYDEKYQNWLNNRKFGIVFLIAKDYQKEKQYYGFDVVLALSSGIVRYFLELCEQIFKTAFLNDYNWEGPILYEIQDASIKYVSEYKILNINGYEPVGRELRIFVQNLGQIFRHFHISDDTTLGEPECNHFSTDDLALSDELCKILSYAVMWNVLQCEKATKIKQSLASHETVDYYLNKIYLPYFQISYRNKRKLNIHKNDLIDLLSGEAEKAEKAKKNYIAKRGKKKKNIVFEKNNDNGQQICILENFGEQND